MPNNTLEKNNKKYKPRKVVHDMSDFAKDLRKEHSSIFYIAYIDILGTKKIVENDENDIYLNKLNNIVHNALHDLDSFKKSFKKQFFIKIFSDNILFAIKVEENDQEESVKVLALLQLVGHLQNRILQKGYFARGAITKGDFYIDEKGLFVHGKALIDAVSLEENNAIYPRVILHPNIEILHEPLTLKDNDGFYFVNNYHCAVTAILIITKPILLEKLEEFKDDLKTRQKILWYISYHNEHAKYVSAKEHPIFKEHVKDIISNEEIANALK